MSDEVSRREVVKTAAVVAGAAMVGITAAAQAQERKGDFNPNHLTFEQGVERIKKAGGGRPDKIVTSKDPAMTAALEKLKVDNVPGGFEKSQLPVLFVGGPGAQFFVSKGKPNTDVRRHSHDEGDGFRFIIKGSIIYEGQELAAGDWMFVPKGAPYSFRVGATGADIFYCYQCCCA